MPHNLAAVDRACGAALGVGLDELITALEAAGTGLLPAEYRNLLAVGRELGELETKVQVAAARLRARLDSAKLLSHSLDLAREKDALGCRRLVRAALDSRAARRNTESTE